MQRERRDFPPSEGADDTGEVETAHLPVTGSTELSSNKYGFLNRLLLPRTRSPSSPLKTRGKDAGAFRDHAPEVGFRLISSSFSTETYGNALLSARDRDRDKRRWLWKPQLSTHRFREPFPQPRNGDDKRTPPQVLGGHGFPVRLPP